MKLASFKTAKGASYGVVNDKGIVDLGRRLGNQYADLKAVIAADAFSKIKSFLNEKADYRLAEVTLLPVIPNPDKIICVGLNYQDHVVETGRDNTEQPATFLRLPESQVGHGQPIVRPKESTHPDFEAEIASTIGKAARRISQANSWSHIAGYSCANDGSVRDWRRPTMQWTAGKNFAATGGFGPWMASADEIPAGTKMTLSCRLNGQQMQPATTEQ